jgi:hypothetical protein
MSFLVSGVGVLRGCATLPVEVADVQTFLWLPMVAFPPFGGRIRTDLSIHRWNEANVLTFMPTPP